MHPYLPQLADAHQPAVQVANLLLRWCVPTKCVHLLRTLPPDSTAQFCKDVDSMVEDAFCAINDCATQFGQVQRNLYETPTAWGGLGVRPLHAVRNAAFVGCWMNCLAHARQHQGPVIRGFDTGWDPGGRATYSFHGEYWCALDAVNTELGAEQDAYDVLGVGIWDLRSMMRCGPNSRSAKRRCRGLCWRNDLGRGETR